MKNTFAAILFCVSLLVSCESQNKAFLVGDWHGAAWTVDGDPSDYDAKQIHFHFAQDGGYSSDFGGDKEKGTYIVRSDKLYTTAEDQLEIMVKIKKLTKDSLVFDMDRSGHPETLTLVRKQ